MISRFVVYFCLLFIFIFFGFNVGSFGFIIGFFFCRLWSPLGVSWVLSGSRPRNVSSTSPSGAPLGTLLGFLLGGLGRISGRLGPSWDPPGGLLGRLGEASGQPLGGSFESSWGPIGAHLLGVFCASGVLLGSPSGPAGGLRGPLGAEA